MLTDEETKNYSVRYEMPIGARGTRLGFAYSETNYDFTSFSVPGATFDSVGESKGISVYGLTPLYRSKADRLTLIYGYDRRDIEEYMNYREFDWRFADRDKDANVWHVGLSGSRYGVNQFLQYSLIYWYGDISTDGGAYYDGGYHKLTADVLKIWYWGKFNARVRARGQLASRALDGSEQFFLGGINGVRDSSRAARLTAANSSSSAASTASAHTPTATTTATPPTPPPASCATRSASPASSSRPS